MYGISAYFTGGLRANFAGSDLIVETNNPRKKLWVQVKTGAPLLKEQTYLTQSSGERDLKGEKFSSDFVIFINLDLRVAKSHTHEGEMNFSHLSFYVVPSKAANRLYKRALNHWAEKPKRNGERRKLANMAVHVSDADMRKYKDAWHLIKSACDKRA
jgi:hypothetical protein